jgi:hypothetical protein
MTIAWLIAVIGSLSWLMGGLQVMRLLWLARCVIVGGPALRDCSTVLVQVRWLRNSAFGLKHARHPLACSKGQTCPSLRACDANKAPRQAPHRLLSPRWWYAPAPHGGVQNTTLGSRHPSDTPTDPL